MLIPGEQAWAYWGKEMFIPGVLRQRVPQRPQHAAKEGLAPGYNNDWRPTTGDGQWLDFSLLFRTVLPTLSRLVCDPLDSLDRAEGEGVVAATRL